MKIGLLYPPFREKILLLSKKAAKIDAYVFMDYRSFAEQHEIWKKGRDLVGNIVDPDSVVTNARPGQSYHNYGLAADFVFKVNGAWSWAENNPWQELGMMGEAIGLEWGGVWERFPDRPHFQMSCRPDLLTDTEWLNVLKKKLTTFYTLSSVWEYIDEVSFRGYKGNGA